MAICSIASCHKQEEEEMFIIALLRLSFRSFMFHLNTATRY